MTRTCAVCHGSFEATRADAVVCGPTCRQRKRRHGLPVSAELRAEVAEFLQRHGHGHPQRDPLTPDEVAAHALATAERT